LVWGELLGKEMVIHWNEKKTILRWNPSWGPKKTLTELLVSVVPRTSNRLRDGSGVLGRRRSN